VLPGDLSFAPEKGKPEDITGYWKGALEVQGMRLRLTLKIGKGKDGAYAGTMASLDQGGREIPMNSISVTNPAVRLECKTIRGVYQGTINPEGTIMDGKWEQMGNPTPLKFERTNAPEGSKTP
jgi:hypothetical protein